MFKTLSFRQKIFFSQFFLFLAFLILLFPFGEKTVSEIVRHSLEENSYVLIDEMKKASDEQGMIDYLKNEELFIFFRVSIIDQDHNLIYDSHLYRGVGETYLPHEHPQVLDAFKTGTAFEVAWSETFERKFTYVAVRFDFHGKQYVICTTFPYAQVEILTRNFQIGIFTVDIIFLAFFGLTTWIIFSRLSSPIQDIIQAIKPYQEGKEENIPKINLGGSISDDDDFSRLARTLNSLSEKVQMQIKSLTEERNEKEAVLESLVEGVIAVDAEGVIRYVNYTGSKMLGIAKRHLLGKHFPEPGEKMRKELLEKCRFLLKSAQDQGTVMTDSVSIGDGPKIYLDLIAAPKAPGQGAILVLQDKSTHYKVLEMGKDFVANASHELRTPITIIKGFAETLQDLPQISHDMLADITEKIVRNCQRMDTLVKNLLTLADIENIPETRFQDCDITSLVENCSHMLHSVYPDATVDIQRGERYLVAADPDLLELAIMNLLDNAAKYSLPPAHITVKFEPTDDEVKVTISDRGIGIPEEDLEHIFERFYTVDKAHSRRLGGAGLGLSIVKTIIEKHEGSITATSKVGKGTTFTILLPKHRTTFLR